MENEKFQQAVLEKLDALKTDVSGLKTDVSSLKDQVAGLDSRLGRLEESVTHIQAETAGLMEFRVETKEALENLADTQSVFSGVLGEHEIQIRKIIRRIV